MFICWGNQNHSANNKPVIIAAIKKYALSHVGFLSVQNAAIKFVGSAHAIFKLFLQTVWSVANHINIISIPIKPVTYKRTASKNLIVAFAHEVFKVDIKNKNRQHKVVIIRGMYFHEEIC